MARLLSRVAEGLVRAGSGDSVRWGEYTLSTHFQPIYSVRKGACLGFEALVRALDGAGSLVPTNVLFAEAFQKSEGVILGWICRALHLRSFATCDSGDRRLFINVHPEAAAADAGSIRELDDLIRYYGLEPRRVSIEILQHPCSDDALLRKAVGAYRQAGMGVAMDDFGIGSSNFDRLVSLRPELVKMDRSMLVQAVGDAKARRLLPALVELLHEAGSQVVIEGVENAGEAHLAVEAGADHLQGFYFARPGPTPSNDHLNQQILEQLHRMRERHLTLVGVG